MKEEKKKPDNPTKMISVSRYFGMAFELLATVLIATFVGQWLDGKINWETPIVTALLIPIFLFGYIYKLYLQLYKEN